MSKEKVEIIRGEKGHTGKLEASKIISNIENATTSVEREAYKDMLKKAQARFELFSSEIDKLTEKPQHTSPKPG